MQSLPDSRDALKKLAVVVPSLIEGGGVPAVARFVVEAALRSRRFTPQLVSLSVSRADPCSLRIFYPGSWLHCPKAEPGIWEGWPYIHVGAVGGEFEFQRYRPRQVLTRTLASADVIQVISGSPAWACSVLGLGKPVALQVATLARVERRWRDRGSLGVVGRWRRMMTALTDRFDAHALRHVAAVQVENPWMLEHVAKVNGSRQLDLRYAPPGINARRFRPAQPRIFGQDDYILCVGRLGDPRKNIEMLLEAYARLPGMLRARVRLVMAGASPPPLAFWEKAENNGLRERVTYVARPSHEELLGLYQRACVFALPSDEEGLGVVVLEAMACAVPVVATRSGGPDGIIQDGKDGYLVPRDDAVAMAARLQVLIDDPQHNITMGLRARTTIEHRYDELGAGNVFVEMWEALAGS